MHLDGDVMLSTPVPRKERTPPGVGGCWGRAGRMQPPPYPHPEPIPPSHIGTGDHPSCSPGVGMCGGTSRLTLHILEGVQWSPLPDPPFRQGWKGQR